MRWSMLSYEGSSIEPYERFGTLIRFSGGYTVHLRVILHVPSTLRVCPISSVPLTSTMVKIKKRRRHDTHHFRCLHTRLPIELCEMVIDMLSPNVYVGPQPVAIRALWNFSLVCKALRTRSQMRLFHSVLLTDNHSLQAFRNVLRGAKGFSSYVRQLVLSGSSVQADVNLFAFFPSALAGKLPNLNKLCIANFPKAASVSDNPLPCIPFHRFFPSLFSSMTAVTCLHLQSITFPNFGDFAKMINSFPNLHTLKCHDIRWKWLGPLPACMKPSQEMYPSSCTFAPRLRDLVVCPHYARLLYCDSHPMHTG